MCKTMNRLNHNKHIELIYSELIYQTNEFKKLLKKQAAKMFIDKELFLCRYLGFDKSRGNVLLKFDHLICLPPRRNEVLLCFISKIQNDKVKNWGGMTYEQMRSQVVNQFEARTIFFEYSGESSIVGVSGIGANDIEKYKKNDLVFLAPNDPPLEYLMNLHSYLEASNPTNEPILNLNIDNQKWKPEPLIVDSLIVQKIQLDFMETDTIVIQGPPGTGKTYLMAKLCAAFLKEGFNTLVTALTNRALVELAEKKFLEDALRQGVVFKSSLSADEQRNKKLLGLQSFKSLSEQRPPLLLTSYYVMSQIATLAMSQEHFDYIIIEEASQAFLSTIAIAKKLGKKCIIIGDIKQLEPIFRKEFLSDNPNNFHYMICGLKAMSFYFSNCKQYMLTDSYRLNSQSVRATNSFYNDALISKSEQKFPLAFNTVKLENYFNKMGGTSFKLFDLSKDKRPTEVCTEYILETISLLKDWNEKINITILAFHRNSVRNLQSEIYKEFPQATRIIVETIDRIQGMTTDICLFFIPLEAFPFALRANRFNVATSRARLCTLIIADNSLNEFSKECSKDIVKYFERIEI